MKFPINFESSIQIYLLTLWTVISCSPNIVTCDQWQLSTLFDPNCTSICANKQGNLSYTTSSNGHDELATHLIASTIKGYPGFLVFDGSSGVQVDWNGLLDSSDCRHGFTHFTQPKNSFGIVFTEIFGFKTVSMKWKLIKTQCSESKCHLQFVHEISNDSGSNQMIKIFVDIVSEKQKHEIRPHLMIGRKSIHIEVVVENLTKNLLSKNITMQLIISPERECQSLSESYFDVLSFSFPKVRNFIMQNINIVDINERSFCLFKYHHIRFFGNETNESSPEISARVNWRSIAYTSIKRKLSNSYPVLYSPLESISGNKSSEVPINCYFNSLTEAFHEYQIDLFFDQISANDDKIGFTSWSMVMGLDNPAEENNILLWTLAISLTIFVVIIVIGFPIILCCKKRQPIEVPYWMFH